MSMDWFRHWHGTVSDPKFILIGKKSNSRRCEVIAVWDCLLEHASTVTLCNADVTRGNIDGFDFESCDALLEINEGQSLKIYDAMIERGLVKDGCITNWEKRQRKKEDDSSDRVAKHRFNCKIKELEEKNKELLSQLTGQNNKENVTPCNDDVTPCNDQSHDVTLDKIREDKNINNNSNELLSGKPNEEPTEKIYDCKNPGGTKLGLKTHVLIRPGEVRNEACKIVIEKIFKKLNTTCGSGYECFRGGEITANGKTVFNLLKRYYPCEIAKVIERKAHDWGDDEKMADYLRPKTLFAKANFENYLGQLPQEETT